MNQTRARVGIGPFSPQLRDKNAHFSGGININLLNHTIPILTILVSVLVSASVGAIGVSGGSGRLRSPAGVVVALALEFGKGEFVMGQHGMIC